MASPSGPAGSGTGDPPPKGGGKPSAGQTSKVGRRIGDRLHGLRFVGLSAAELQALDSRQGMVHVRSDELFSRAPLEQSPKTMNLTIDVRPA